MAMAKIVEVAVTSITDLIIEGLFTKACNKLASFIDLMKIKGILQRYSTKYFQETYELLGIHEEFDFFKLNTLLSEKLEKIIAIECMPISERTLFEQRLTDEAISYCIKLGDSSDMYRNYHVKVYIQAIFRIIKEFFIENISQKEKLFACLITDEIYNIISHGMEELSEHISKLLNYRGSFEEMINSIEFDDSSISGCSFRNKDIGFYGRSNECKALDRFLADNRMVLFWAVTGVGGSGKSKLVHEYSMRKFWDPNWRVCNLKQNADHVKNLLSFNSYEYPSNLLLIIDDAGTVTDIIHKWLSKLQTKRERKLRLLLVERQGMLFDDFGKKVEPNWYFRLNGCLTTLSEERSFIDRLEYRDTEYTDFLTLSNLSISDLSCIFDDYAHHINVTRLTKVEKEKIAKYLLNIENNKSNDNSTTIRPIFALLAADAALNGGVYQHWNADKLVGSVLSRNKSHWLKVSCEGDEQLFCAIEDLLIYSTMGIPWKLGTQLAKPLDKSTLVVNSYKKSKIEKALCDILGINCFTGMLLPVEPDLVGELFVLEYLSEVHKSDFEVKLIKLMWESAFDNFIFFLLKCIGDYGKDPRFGEILLFIIEESLPFLIGCNLYYDVLLLKFNLSQLNKIVDPIVVLQQIKEFLNNSPRNEIQATLFSNCLFESVFIVNSNGLVDVFNLYKDLAISWPESLEIAAGYATSMINIATKCSRDFVATIGKSLDELMRKWLKNENMMGLYAEGLYNQLANGEFKNAKEVLAKIKGIVVCWPNSERLATVYAEGLSFIGQIVRGKHALKLLDEIGMLTKYWKSDDILLEYAVLEIHLESDLTISNDLEYNLYVINHIENCLTYWPNSTRILELYGRNLVSLANKQEDNEAAHTVNILRELFKTNPDNVLIAIMYTAGLFNRLAKSKGDRSDLFKMMSEVKNKWPLNNDIQTLYNYAKSILNTNLVSDATRINVEQQIK